MIEEMLKTLAASAPADSFFNYPWNIAALIALTLVALICGATGSLVVGARMAFFSDALAHSSFAGVSIGFVLVTVFMTVDDRSFWSSVTPIMLGFGMIIGYGIAWARERTGLTNDTVIGVFFAGSTGLAAALRQLIQDRRLFTLEDFLFGNPLGVGGDDLVALTLLALLTGGVLMLIYNPLLLGGFNPSLARSRRLPHVLASYVFIMLLALVVNLTVRTVGVLLINALLVVPAAGAINLGRNLRQVFWLSVLMCLVSSLGGLFLCWEVETRLHIRLGIPGTIVLLSVTIFALSAIIGPFAKRLPEQRPQPAS
ncbi:MAG: metal ABC transporter permease [Planctomycetia bacterium]|nr:metal ABC transporter permease [Planctomycetia bacterium]